MAERLHRAGRRQDFKGKGTFGYQIETAQNPDALLSGTSAISNGCFLIGEPVRKNKKGKPRFGTRFTFVVGTAEGEVLSNRLTSSITVDNSTRTMPVRPRHVFSEGSSVTRSGLWILWGEARQKSAARSAMRELDTVPAISVRALQDVPELGIKAGTLFGHIARNLDQEVKVNSALIRRPRFRR